MLSPQCSRLEYIGRWESCEAQTEAPHPHHVSVLYPASYSPSCIYGNPWSHTGKPDIATEASTWHLSKLKGDPQCGPPQTAVTREKMHVLEVASSAHDQTVPRCWVARAWVEKRALQKENQQEPLKHSLFSPGFTVLFTRHRKRKICISRSLQNLLYLTSLSFQKSLCLSPALRQIWVLAPPAHGWWGERCGVCLSHFTGEGWDLSPPRTAQYSVVAYLSSHQTSCAFYWGGRYIKSLRRSLNISTWVPELCSWWSHLKSR